MYMYINSANTLRPEAGAGVYLSFILFIINIVWYACYGETCPWYAFRGQGITLWSWLSAFIFPGVLRMDFRSSDWWDNLLTLLRHLQPLLYSETMSLTECVMHGFGNTGWPQRLYMSASIWGCGCFQRVLGNWTQIPMLVWPSEPVP